MNEVDVLVIGGGQAGLAAAHAVRRAGREPAVLEAGSEPVGSWPSYYDSLTLFSPARFSSLPGMMFPGDPDRYPQRDEVVDYLRRYAKNLDVAIHTGQRVDAVTAEGGGFVVRVTDGTQLRASAVIAATGAFGRPFRPVLPGLDRFTGTLIHAADYAEPSRFAGQRVVVVGAANSAMQIGAELTVRARVSLATRRPVRFAPQRPLGRDIHLWLRVSGVDALPIGPLLRTPPHMPANDDGRYRRAIRAGQPDQRRMFTDIDGTELTRADGGREQVDTIILATGYRPDLSYLQPLGVAVEQPWFQRRGLSTMCPGLGFVGLEWQHSFASATLRGVGRDAHYVVRRLLARRSQQPRPHTGHQRPSEIRGRGADGR